MSVNRFVIRQDVGVDKQINIPVELKWDYLGLDLAIDEYETKVIKEVIGDGRDFEVSRFAHAPATGTTNDTLINYEFYFYSGGSLNDLSNWRINYLSEGFTPQEVYYYDNVFSNSFFKLDFYDTPDEKKQINYLTAIIPTQQGEKQPAILPRALVDIKKPKFKLDYVGDKEGFFIYWLKKRNFLDISTFYMSAKFYDARTGFFLRMMNKPQSFFPNSQFTFDTTRYFYYIMKIDYPTQTYRIFDSNNVRFGQPNNPVVWYEFINP
jgi:hypothetical protein